MAVKGLARAFTRVTKWLEENAPRTRASLLPPLGDAELDALAERMGRRLPAELEALYRLSGGQSEGAKVGIFNGYFFMRTDGVDGVEHEWRAMREAPWGTAERFPFAKDFGGAYLLVDERDDGAVLEIVDGEVEDTTTDLELWIDGHATRMEEGGFEIDETIEEVVETAEVLFDAARVRVAGDVVKHSVFERLGIVATVEALEAHASPFDKTPFVHGFFVRLVPPRDGIKVTDVKMYGPNGQRPAGWEFGHGSGGGKPGQVVFARSQTRAAVPGSRLRVEIQVTRRV